MQIREDLREDMAEWRTPAQQKSSSICVHGPQLRIHLSDGGVTKSFNFRCRKDEFFGLGNRLGLCFALRATAEGSDVDWSPAWRDARSNPVYGMQPMGRHTSTTTLPRLT